MRLTDPYKVLGVRRTAGDEEIHRAYRARAKALHPDTVPPGRRAAATRRFQELQAAHAILSDPRLRMAYDMAHPPRRLLGRRRTAEQDAFLEQFFLHLLRGMMR